MDKSLNRLTSERDRLNAEVEAIKARIEGLNFAIATIEGDAPTTRPTTRANGATAPRKRGKNVKATVLAIVERSALAGVTAADVLAGAERMGNPLERTSVSTLLSNLKRAGVLEYKGDRYRMKAGKAKPATRRGRPPATKRKAKAKTAPKRPKKAGKGKPATTPPAEAPAQA